MKHIFTVLAMTLSVFCSAKVPVMYNNANHGAMNDWVDFTYNALTPDERIGQLIVAVVTPDGTESAKNRVKEYVEKYSIGGLLFSKGTIKNHASLANYAQSISSTPLLMTLDGEWGPAMRMPDAPLFPKNMVVGAVNDDRIVYEYGAEVARECRRLGVHVNFAPVLDVNTNSKNPVIGYRSFGERPDMVARKGIAYAKGLEDGGVLSVAKHFPGHGNTSEDSHKTLPSVDRSLAQLKIYDIAPFKYYINAGLGGILVAHLNVPALGAAEVPTSLSKRVNDYLCRELDFEGLVFTDALAMKGATSEGSNCVAALLAGNDVLLYPADVGKEFKALKTAVEDGSIPQSLIEKKCKKMLRYKYLLGLSEPQQVNTDNIESDINSPQADLIIRKLWSNAITVIRNKNNALPVKDLRKDIAVLSLGGGSDSEFNETCALYAGVKFFSAGDFDNADEKYNTVIAGIYGKGDYSRELERLSGICKNVIAVFFISPYSMHEYTETLALPNVSSVMAYDKCDYAQNYAAQAVFGGIDVSGTLPVSIDGVAKAGTGVKLKKTRLGYTVPEEVGVKSSLLAFIDSIAGAGVKSNAFPGCQVLVAKDGMVICNRSYGYLDNGKKDAVDIFSLYDLASVSKAAATLPGIMKAYDMGLIRLEDRASRFIQDLRNTDKKNITIKDLLFHETGMPGSVSMNNLMFDTLTYSKPLFKKRKDNTYSIRVDDNTYGNRFAKLRKDILSRKRSETFDYAVCRNLYCGRITYDSIMADIYNIKLRNRKDYNYSCLNFCLLMRLEENVTHIPHDEFVYENIFIPLGANRSSYNPLGRFSRKNIAETEYDTFLRREHLRGYVHDELAAFSGGVQGNAGFFSNANDIAKLCQMWLNKGVYGNERFLSPSTVKLFTTEKSLNSRRGLGFDKPDKTNDKNSPTCPEATASTFGHLGFTGTCFWVDPENNLIYVFLSNRVDPSRNNPAFEKLDIRPRIFTEIYNSIDIEKH